MLYVTMKGEFQLTIVLMELIREKNPEIPTFYLLKQNSNCGLKLLKQKGWGQWRKSACLYLAQDHKCSTELNLGNDMAIVCFLYQKRVFKKDSGPS